MRILSKTALTVALAAVMGVAMGQSRPPRNSYIERRIYSAQDLVRQLRSDPVVMDRYRRHFAMSNDEVIEYLSSLRTSKLAKDGVYTVYGVPRSTGDFHSNLRLLKKGEPVLVEADGTPVLMLVCGNPLILGPKKPTIGNPVVSTTGAVEGAREITPDSPPVPTPPQGEASVPPVGSAPNPIPPPDQPHGVSPLPMLLGLAGSIGIFLNHHKSPPPVPEPMTMLVMAGGIAAMAARRKAKKS